MKDIDVQVSAMIGTTLQQDALTYRREAGLLHARTRAHANSMARPLQRKMRDAFHKAGGLLVSDQHNKEDTQ
jgi:hypothetical protein